MKQFASTTWGMAAVLVYACGSSDDVRAPSPDPSSSPQQIVRAPQPPPACADAVPIWSDGEPAGAVCPADAAARGLTIVDLSDGWTPAALTPPADAPPLAYRATYQALAAETWSGAGADAERAKDDRYLELYGIEPSLSVIRTRLSDTPRHTCHALVFDLPIALLRGTITEEPLTAETQRIGYTHALAVEVERLRTMRHAATLEALAATGPAMKAAVDQLRAAELRLAAIKAVQQHLACDGLYDLKLYAEDGNYSWETSTPMEQFQRATMVLPTGDLDQDSRTQLLIGSRERDFRAALRVLRERVIAASGIIEDGTAGAGMTTVLGRALEPATTWRVKGYKPEPDGAPDLVSPATEAAAHALGWNDPNAVLAFLVAHGPGSAAAIPKVAIALPPVPAWHTATMDLSAVIDRGDVWYDPVPTPHTPARRPSITLYATVGAKKIALVRWPTTIGGWNDEKDESADIDKKWKESPVGKRVWHDVWLAPTWIPPDGTPDKDLLRVGADERYHLRRDVLGPGYRSAFGMVALVHEIPEKGPRGAVVYEEEGIRTHGAANLSSIANGFSHGCHRLLGVDALRLSGFVLAHRAHTYVGPQKDWWRRIVRYRGRTFPARLDDRGYLVQVDPPVPIEVLPGRIRSERKRPYPSY